MEACPECIQNRTALAREFRELQPLFVALGDETRQRIFLALLEAEQVGLRTEALAGPKSAQRSIGYGGEQAVLLAQSLGLNTCWVAMTYRRGKVPCAVEAGEKLHCVIALGYGTTQGVSHPVKPPEQLCRVEGAMPAWFRQGMEAAQLAPTAMNQQKFLFTLEGTDTVRAKALAGPYAQIDLGIAMCHFALGAGTEGWRWAD